MGFLTPLASLDIRPRLSSPRRRRRRLRRCAISNTANSGAGGLLLLLPPYTLASDPLRSSQSSLAHGLDSRLLASSPAAACADLHPASSGAVVLLLRPPVSTRAYAHPLSFSSLSTCTFYLMPHARYAPAAPRTMVGLSEGEKHFIRGGIAQDLRTDGRRRLQFRAISVETGVIPQVFGFISPCVFSIGRAGP